MTPKPLLIGCYLLAAGSVLAVPVPQRTTDVVKDRAGFIPQRKYFPLEGKMIGVLVSDVAPMMGQEGRSGPPKAYGFSAGGGSYRWIYTRAKEKSVIQNLQVRVGANGDRVEIYPMLNMADPDTLKQWDIAVPFALVEVEVNDGLGAPADEGFVATKMKRLDGTRETPLVLPQVVADAKKRYQRYVEEQKNKIDEALTAAADAHLSGKKLTGPRETKELFYITWLPESERIRIHFRTQVTDGAFENGGANGNGIQRLPRLPRDNPRGGGPFGFFPPPPPRPLPVRFGTIVGVEFGLALEVTRTGKLDRTLVLPIQDFHRVLPPPPTPQRQF